MLLKKEKSGEQDEECSKEMVGDYVLGYVKHFTTQCRVSTTSNEKKNFFLETQREKEKMLVTFFKHFLLLNKRQISCFERHLSFCISTQPSLLASLKFWYVELRMVLLKRKESYLL